MSKQRYTISVDEGTIGKLQRIAMKKGNSQSDIVETYIIRGLAKETELTAAERMVHADKVINISLDNLLKLYGILAVEGGLQQKFLLFSALTSNFLDAIALRERKGVFETSLFEVLNDVKDYDMSLYLKLKKGMNKYLKQKYLELYPDENQRTL